MPPPAPRSPCGAPAIVAAYARIQSHASTRCAKNPCFRRFSCMRATNAQRRRNRTHATRDDCRTVAERSGGRIACRPAVHVFRAAPSPIAQDSELRRPVPGSGPDPVRRTASSRARTATRYPVDTDRVPETKTGRTWRPVAETVFGCAEDASRRPRAGRRSRRVRASRSVRRDRRSPPPASSRRRRRPR